MKILTLFLFIISLPCYPFEFQGKALPNLELSGDEGGRLNGKSWSLKEMLNQKKVLVIFYVDPDVKDKNEEISERLNKRNFPKEDVQYIGMINLAATWLPNFAISGALKKKQKKYPATLYLRDYDKKAVKVWKVADDENDIIVLNSEGVVSYHKFGYVNKEEGDQLMELLEKLVKEKSSLKK